MIIFLRGGDKNDIILSILKELKHSNSVYTIIKYDINWRVKKKGRGRAYKWLFACQGFCATLHINPGNINAQAGVECLSVLLSVNCQTVKQY